MLNLLTSDDFFDRWRAAEALGERGDARAVPALTRLESDPEESVRQAAAQALSQLFPGQSRSQ